MEIKQMCICVFINYQPIAAPAGLRVSKKTGILNKRTKFVCKNMLR